MSLWLFFLPATAIAATLPPWACDRILKESYGAFHWLHGEDSKVRALCAHVVVGTLRMARDPATAEPLCEEFQRKVVPLWNTKPMRPLKEAQIFACHGVKDPALYESATLQERPIQPHGQQKSPEVTRTKSNGLLQRDFRELELAVSKSDSTETASSPGGSSVDDRLQDVLKAHAVEESDGTDEADAYNDLLARYKQDAGLEEGGSENSEKKAYKQRARSADNPTEETALKPDSASSPPEASSEASVGFFGRIWKRLEIIGASILNFICDDKCLKSENPTLHVRGR